MAETVSEVPTPTSRVAAMMSDGRLSFADGIDLIEAFATAGTRTPPKDDPLASLPNDVRVLVENITKGKADPYLEIILSAAHGRKKALRNVPGFVASRV